jgi:DNA ligase-associated metallophosphoesterase
MIWGRTEEKLNRNWKCCNREQVSPNLKFDAHALSAVSNQRESGLRGADNQHQIGISRVIHRTISRIDPSPLQPVGRNAVPESDRASTSDRMQIQELSLAGIRLKLLPQRAVWWEDRSVLFVSDLHFGKEATFRAAGIPVPDQTAEILTRLSFLLKWTHVTDLVVLGDLLHARRGRCETTFEQIRRWRHEHIAVRMHLVRGNHDASAGDPPTDWGFECHDEPHTPAAWQPLALRHTPQNTAGLIGIAGHLHPVVRLSGRARDSARLPCFHLRNDVLTLPAFSPFVDGAAIRPTEGDVIYGICDDQVLQLT